MPISNRFVWIINLVLGLSVSAVSFVCFITAGDDVLEMNAIYPVAGLVILFLSVWFIWKLLADFTMSITPHGITRRFLFKTVNIPWAEVREVSQKEVGVLIRLSRRKIIIPHVRYRLKPPELYDWIIDKIPGNERSRILSLNCYWPN